LAWNSKKGTALNSKKIAFGGIVMAATADTHRHFAEECLRWAEETDNEEQRQAFLDMAVAWMRLITHGPNGEIQAASVAPKGAPYQPSNNPEIG
jgi:hypothetical protein